MKQVKKQETELQRLRNAVKHMTALLKQKEWKLKIEAALEEVRSRSLIMNNSNELPGVAETVFKKLRELSFSVNEGAVGILIFKEGSKDHTQRIADKEHSYPNYFFTPYTEHTLSKDLFAAKESGKEYFSKLYPLKEKNEYFNYLFQFTNYKV